MAEEGAGPGLPAAIKKNQKIIIPVVLVAGAYVAWRYYSAPAAEDTGTITDGEFGAVDGSIPGVLGAVKEGNAYGSGTQEPATTSDYGFTGTTNAQWTQYATTQLQQSDTWSYTQIVTALGNFVNNKPLTSDQQSIVQAAIAVAGYPPSGSHTIIPGGDTGLTVAPSGLRVTTTDDEAVLTFNPVPGAASYRAYRGIGSNIGTAQGTTITVGGLQPGTTYNFYVRAITASGKQSPASAKVAGKTKDRKLKAPSTPRVSSVQKTSAHVTTGKVTGADGYNWYVNGTAHGHSDGPAYTITGLKSRTSYKVSVRADTSTGAPGPSSGHASFKTK